MYRTYMLKTSNTYERDQRINKLRTYQSENWKTESLIYTFNTISIKILDRCFRII